MFRTSSVHPQELFCRNCICRLCYVVRSALSDTSSWYNVVWRTPSSYCKSLNVHILVTGLTTWHNVDQNDCFCIYCCWPARATCVTDFWLAFIGTCNSCRPTTNGAFVNSFDTVHISVRLWMFVTDSFAAERNSVIVCCLKRTSSYYAILTTRCACARKLIVPRRCSWKRDIQN